MKLAIITHVVHGTGRGVYFAYGPYVREMNLWNQYADEVIVVAPLTNTYADPIHLPYNHNNLRLIKVPNFDLLSAAGIVRSAILLPLIFWRVFDAMRRADHIHLRCPGNMGLIGCIIQMLFPAKPKTAKYAGNWDPEAKQPWTYKLQRAILSNTNLTRNIQVLVYGQWPGQSKNIVSFYTATYRDADKVQLLPRALSGSLRFMFVGTLSSGKVPIYALQIVEQLRAKGHNVRIDFYGEGAQRTQLEKYIKDHQLQDTALLHGNKTEAEVREAYQNAHFLLLASRSEGWPKVVAEAMFWGCVPAATKVSCVASMLDHGNRGILLQNDLRADVAAFESILKDEAAYNHMASLGLQWAQRYTLDRFESSIQQMLIR